MLPNIFYLTVHDLLYQIEQVIAIDAKEKKYTNTLLFDFKEKNVIWLWNAQISWVILKIAEGKGSPGALRHFSVCVWQSQIMLPLWPSKRRGLDKVIGKAFTFKHV